MELIIQFIAKLLDPSQSESAALFVGDLVSKLIKKGGDLVTSIIPDLLNAVTQRLAQAKLPTFIQVLYTMILIRNQDKVQDIHYAGMLIVLTGFSVSLSFLFF